MVDSNDVSIERLNENLIAKGVCGPLGWFFLARFTHPESKRGGSSSHGVVAAASSRYRAAAAGADEEENGSSWLSLVDWEACLRRTADHSFFRVVGPLSLG